MSSATQYVKTQAWKGKIIGVGENKRNVQSSKMILWCHSEAQSRLGHRTPPGRRQSKNLGEPVSNADIFHASSMRNIAKYRRYSAFRKDLTKEIAMTNFNTYT